MAIEIKVPAVGESITEATIAEWLKKDGEWVDRNEVLFQLETDKASVEVVAEQAGTLKIGSQAGEIVKIGGVVGTIDNSATRPQSGSPTSGLATSTKPNKAPASLVGQPTKSMAHPEKSSQDLAAVSATTQDRNSGSPDLAPSVRRLVEENGINPREVTASGKGGRLTKGDVLLHLEKGPSVANPPPPVTKPPINPAAENGSSTARNSAPLDIAGGAMLGLGGAPVGGVRREKMSSIRKRIAERLVESQQTAAILTTFNEVDMSAVLALREKYKEAFQKKFGVNLGFMGFFVKAAVEALKAFPKLNASLAKDEIIYHGSCHVGIAVGTEKGLIVPVIKNAQSLSLAAVEEQIRGFANKAREGKITIDDLSGGTFTISNGGVYGSLMSTPILNPPQTGILGMHKIEERPIAINGQVVIRPMMYLALSYDHRLVDGSESVRFLVKIKEGIEDPQRLLLEI